MSFGREVLNRKRGIIGVKKDIDRRWNFETRARRCFVEIIVEHIHWSLGLDSDDSSRLVASLLSIRSSSARLSVARHSRRRTVHMAHFVVNVTLDCTANGSVSPSLPLGC